MAGRTHRYTVTLRWTGNAGSGTSGYRAYRRDHVTEVAGKPPIPGSSYPAFRGDPARWNPEELLVSSLSSCHMLWFLHLCADAGVVVTGYIDRPEGEMAETPDGGGRFSRVILRPEATLAAGSDIGKARHLHHLAHEKCFIANSVNFPVQCEPVFRTAAESADA
jgi:organic hydroperoxide reductase OsmC/OhrA